LDKTEGIVIDDPGRIIIKENRYKELYEKLHRIASGTFQIDDRDRSNEDLDEALRQKLEKTGSFKSSRKS
jgi:ribosomal protein S21